MATIDKPMTEAIERLAYSVKTLGLNDAATHMGAIEVLSMEVKEGTTRIAEAINNLAEAIREHADA